MAGHNDAIAKARHGSSRRKQRNSGIKLLRIIFIFTLEANQEMHVRQTYSDRIAIAMATHRQAPLPASPMFLTAHVDSALHDYKHFSALQEEPCIQSHGPCNQRTRTALIDRQLPSDSIKEAPLLHEAGDTLRVFDASMTKISSTIEPERKCTVPMERSAHLPVYVSEHRRRK